MKKYGKLLIGSFLAGCLLFTGCGGTDSGGSDDSAKESVKIATMEEFYFKDVVEAAKTALEKEGISVEIVTFADNVTPNVATMEGSVDYNFFEHVPFLDAFNESDKGGDLVVVGEPLTVGIEGLYSNKFSSIDEITDGATVGIPNDSSNRTMHLKFLDRLGLITLNDSESEVVDLSDIKENPHNFNFVEMDTPSIVRSLDDIDLGTCSQSSIVKRGIDPNTALETYSDPSLGIVLVTKAENVDTELTEKVYEAFKSQEVKDVLKEKYDNVVEPLF
ncbi:MetQ/NlpA family ABC transporter substrate-binding protein [Gallibacter sp. Marseille-QA0791]|uniref:MetQ/NlpA family ABC transporter substrate-binding protein n=1 Tax=Gallibacter sp. Marseille-QA0791 TaxID=3378781 RepID=UPI003D0AC5D1